ncbi:MAG: hypothetical protein JWO14_3664 [Solirubrobacterales bacterium]|jgi:hypothetical protein|nr:hypothetical protein [Solirubrobacterales bacterium]
MNRTLQATDERINALVDELARMTGQDYVSAMCQALEEMHERLVSGRDGGPRVIRLRVEADIPEDLLHRSNR